MLKGLPGSGKTTRAKELVTQGWIRVNKDDLRAMMFDGVEWNRDLEKLVEELHFEGIRIALKHGHDVVIDNTNLKESDAEDYAMIAHMWRCEFSIEEMNTSLGECIKRDAKRARMVGRDVIVSMYERYYT